MRKFILAAAALATVSTAAYAAVTFDAGTGTGFVGKGDVQLAFTWNNKQLQDNAANVDFRFVGETVTEVTWTCTKQQNNGETIQVRERTTTTSIAGVVDSIGRERNQITGFNLLSYDGAPTTSSTTVGDPLNSCPAASSGFVLSSPAGDPEVISQTGGLEVSAPGRPWTPIS